MDRRQFLRGLLRVGGVAAVAPYAPPLELEGLVAWLRSTSTQVAVPATAPFRWEQRGEFQYELVTAQRMLWHRFSEQLEVCMLEAARPNRVRIVGDPIDAEPWPRTFTFDGPP